jgi:hypothetical protein
MKLDKRKFNSLKNKAEKALSNLESKQDDLIEFFQSFFNVYIVILYQFSDGFCIMPLEKRGENNTDAPQNISITYAFDSIKENPDCFMHFDKLEYEDDVI